MKPTKPGYYWYRDEPVKVWSHYKVGLCFYRISITVIYRVEHTEDSDWGPEIKGDGE